MAYKRRYTVYCKHCKGYRDTEEVKFIDIEEDIQGHDVMTFECDSCHTKQKSHVRG